eukprot:GFUD01012532.1.p1 GENE.GFUD01012532.1~~GFUD01012532.1.p1  ORF type:complete len:524 (+),score=66.39 GFUD01012532.1:159-1730(+)
MSRKNSSEQTISKPVEAPCPAKMSTSEMHLLTGTTRQVEVQAHEHLPDDGFRYKGNTRGKGAKIQKVKNTVTIGRGLPPGITVLNSAGTIVDKGQAGRGGNTRGRAKSRGVTPKRILNGIHPINSNQMVVPRRGSALQNKRVLTGNNLSHNIIDVIDVESDEEIQEVQNIEIPQQRWNNQGYIVEQLQPNKQRPNAFNHNGLKMGVQPRAPTQPCARGPMPPRARMPVQQVIRGPKQPPFRIQPRGRLATQQGLRQPMMHQGVRQTVQSVGRVIVQNGRAHNSQVNQMNLQPRGVRPRQRAPVPIQRGPIPIQRGPVPIQRSPMQRGVIPVQRGSLPRRRGNSSVQTVIYPSQRGVQSSQRGLYSQRGVSPRPRGTMTRGMPSQRRMISNPIRVIRPYQVRGRGIPVQPQSIMMGTRPQRGMMNRGRQPAVNRRSRARGRAAVVRGNPRIVSNQNFDQISDITNDYSDFNGSMSFSDYDDDVIIPTVNPGYQAAPDFDIIADDEIVNYSGGQDDNLIADNYAY